METIGARLQIEKWTEFYEGERGKRKEILEERILNMQIKGSCGNKEKVR